MKKENYFTYDIIYNYARCCADKVDGYSLEDAKELFKWQYNDFYNLYKIFVEDNNLNEQINQSLAKGINAINAINLQILARIKNAEKIFENFRNDYKNKLHNSDKLSFGEKFNLLVNYKTMNNRLKYISDELLAVTNYVEDCRKNCAAGKVIDNISLNKLVSNKLRNIDYIMAIPEPKYEDIGEVKLASDWRSYAKPLGSFEDYIG